MSIVLEGLPELIDALEEFEKASKVSMRKAMGEACALVAGDAKQLVPHENSTGHLQESIGFKVKETADGVEGRVTAATNYAAYVEFGTGARGQATHDNEAGMNPTYTLVSDKTGKTYKGQKAQPYLYPAYKGRKKEIHQLFSDAIKCAAGGD